MEKNGGEDSERQRLGYVKHYTVSRGYMRLMFWRLIFFGKGIIIIVA